MQLLDRIMKEPYTVALTSCGRFDLLEKTLTSLIPRLDPLPEKILLIEDSGNYEVEDVLNQFRGQKLPIETIVNRKNIGQVGSIDRLYSQIETDWIFHCEDDWEFIDSGFIADSYLLMSNYDSCSAVTLMGGPSPNADSCIANVASDVAFFIWDRDCPWSGYTFQPGLRRMRDYRIVGPYVLLDRKMDEVRVSHAYKNLGYRMLMLEHPYIRHIGGGRHVTDPSWEKTWLQRQIRSAKLRFDHMRYRLNPEANPHIHVKRRWEAARYNMRNWIDWDKDRNQS